MPTLWEHFTETEQLKLAKEPDPELESEEETASVVDSGVIKIDNILTIIISATEAKLNKTKQIYIVVSSLPDKVKKKVKGDTTVDIYAHYTSLFEDEDDKTIVAKIVNNMAKSVTDLDASEEKHSNDSGEEIVSISFDEEKMIVEDDSQCLEVSYVLQEQPEILNNAIVPSKRGRSNSEIQKWLLSMENFSREMEQESNPRIMKQKKVSLPGLALSFVVYCIR